MLRASLTHVSDADEGEPQQQETASYVLRAALARRLVVARRSVADILFLAAPPPAISHRPSLPDQAA
jgi:hypothetical protein